MGTMSKRFVAVAAALAAAATLAVAPSGAQPEQSPGQRSQGEPTAPALLDVGGPASTSADQVDAASRVDVDTSLLKPGVARTVSVDVLDDDLEVKLDPIASGAAGWSAWDGSVVSEPDSSATVVRNGDDVAGLVTTPSGVYRIRTTAPGQQVVQAQGVARQQQWGEQDDAQGPEVVDEVCLQHGGVAKACEQQQVIGQQGGDGHQPPGPPHRRRVQRRRQLGTRSRPFV